MSGRIYSITADAVSETTAQDLVRITAAADGILEILHVEVSQETNASSEQLAVQIQRSSTAGTGSAITARPTDVSDTGFGGSAIGTITADTTVSAVMHRKGWNVLNEWVWFPTPELEILLSPSEIAVVRLDEAPTAAMLITTTVWVREKG